MRILSSFLLLVAASVLPIIAVAQVTESQGGQSVLTPGDSVRIAVWRKPEFSGDYVIAPDGSISHPLFREVKVAGVPFQTAESNLRAFLSRFEDNPQFVMEPLIRVAVSGEVTRPQVFAVRPETTIGEAVARAGGIDPQTGAANRVRVLRFDRNGHQEQFRVDLTNPATGNGSMPIHSGDQIVVDRKKSFVKDIFLPALGLVGSVASVGLLIDRINRKN